MKIHVPRIEPEFHVVFYEKDATLHGPYRVLYVLHTTNGSECICNDLNEAAESLEKECKDYLELMKKFP